IPKRVGYARPWRNLFLTRRVLPRHGAVAMHKRSVDEINQRIRKDSLPPAYPADAHHIHQYLHLAAALGANPAPLAPCLTVTAEAIANFIAKFNLAANSNESAPFFGLNAGAEYGPAKRWPEARFIEAAIQIQRQTNCRWLIFGLKAESEMAARIVAEISRAAEKQFGREATANNPRAFNLAGATTLAELCSALKFCRVLLTNDSGPMHVAAALGTPVVVPFGSTSPELTGPGLPGDTRHHLLCAHAPCSPCFLRECPIDFRCMTAISADAVVKAVLETNLK
ncbi:MAG: Lipopolysaccharide heptosyltransferase, partial [Pedosphaera sp.]|nr:Lipopolysaccharide heptosyltransferase [Pedosphaera sp.]